MQIVAIGGGKLSGRETLKIDKFIVELTGKRNPRALFVSTASGDATGYCSIFERIYGGLLGCRVDHLQLLSRKEDRTLAADKIAEANLIYVGGGNTLRMMKFWRRLNIDRLLESAGKHGTVLAGLSAGAVCWHEWGHSDSRAFSEKKDWSYIRVKGLGFREGMFCPHFDAERRRKPFLQMIKRHRISGIACDNNAAIWYHDGKAEIKTSRSQAGVSIFQWTSQRIIETRYRNGEKMSIANNRTE